MTEVTKAMVKAALKAYWGDQRTWPMIQKRQHSTLMRKALEAALEKAEEGLGR